ncbi:MAG: hypothetical protein VXU42_05155, partial [Verrucomicrobiota bacterium]|nr:hypothetical protein [Verrucomicrobiota bacterium]
GDALMAAMGVGDTTDKFISPGANVTIIEKLYNVALGSIDSTITFPGVVQELRDFWSNNAYTSGDVPAEILQRMADQLAELGRKVQLIGDLGTNAVEPMTGRVIPIERKTELLTDPQDMVTWLSYAKSVAMAENNGIYSTTVVGVIDQLATKFTEMTKGKGVLDIYELTTAFTLLAQSCQNIQSMALSGLNKMLKGANITKFDKLVGRSGKDGQPGRDGKRGQGPENKKRKQNDGHAGGRGITPERRKLLSLERISDARGVQLVQQPDGGIGISQSLGADAPLDGP